MVDSNKKKIWIDLDNSPHVPFFSPIIRELKKRGYSTVITTRECSQTCSLADYYKMPYKKIGRHFGKNKILKILGLIVRSLEMIPFLIKEKPDIALSHGSRSQILIAKLLGIKSIMIFDYEYCKGLLVIYPDWSMAPNLVQPNERDRAKTNLLHYPGIKEDVYVPEFRPDPKILKELDIDDKKLIVTLRPPATEAHYHNSESEELLKAAIDMISQNQNVIMVLIPRYENQDIFIRESWPELFKSRKILIPDHVVDGLNLMWHSDLVISGGGTMNREAAALGVPVYSIFRGKIGAVDRYLAKNNRLTLLQSVEDVKTKIVLKHREKILNLKNINSDTLKSVLDSISYIIEKSRGNNNK